MATKKKSAREGRRYIPPKPGPEGGSPKVPNEEGAKLDDGGSPKDVVSHQEKFKAVSPDGSKNPGPGAANKDPRFNFHHEEREVVSHQEQFAALVPDEVK